MQKILFILILSSLAFMGCDRSEFGKRAEGGVVSGDADQQPTAAGNNDYANSGNNGTDGDQGGVLAPTGARETVDAIADATHSVGIDAYLAQSSKEGNIAIGAVGLTKSLVVGSLGAGVETQDALVAALGLPGADAATLAQTMNELDGELQRSAEPGMLQVVPSIWAQSSADFYADYLDSVAYYFDLDVRLVDFMSPDTARLQINNWYRTQTSGYITEVVTPLELEDAITVAFIDASFFSGAWDVPFDRDLSYYGTFAGTDGEQEQRYMYREDVFLVTRTEAYDAAIVPFSNAFSFVAVAPHDTLGTSVEPMLSPTFFTEILANSEVESLALSLPIVEIAGRVDSKDLGLQTAANAESFDAVGAGIGSGVFVQRTKIALGELSVTGTADEAPAGDPDAFTPTPFSLDRPFLFGIVDTATGALIYVGRFQG